MFGLADCNNFYVSCERVFRPELRNKPIIVLSNNDGCVIARSNESKSIGIKMGDPFFKIRNLVEEHNIAVFSSNFPLYGDMSRRVMTILQRHVPHIDIYSIDEAILHLSGLGDSDKLRTRGLEIVKAIAQGLGIPISIGIAPTKTLAKMASKFAKQYPAYHGVCLIDTPQKQNKALTLFPVDQIWGIGRHTLSTLQTQGIKTAMDFVKCKEYWVRRQFGITGVRTWRELQGQSCIEINDLPYKKSICMSRSFPGKGIINHTRLEESIALFATECAAKLRQQHTCCNNLLIHASTSRYNTQAPAHTIHTQLTFPVPTSDTAEIVHATLQTLRQNLTNHPFAYKQAGIVVFNLTPDTAIQTNIFDPLNRPERRKLTKTIDNINARHGHNTVRLAIINDPQNNTNQQKYISKRYTTDINDIPILKL